MAVLSERGQICALGVRAYDLRPITNVSGCSLAYWAVEILRRPVVASTAAPILDWYVWNASKETRCETSTRIVSQSVSTWCTTHPWR